MTGALLERDAELGQLGAAIAQAAGGAGSVVLVAGEAGIGKSSLVKALRDRIGPEVRVLVGWCDDLATPRAMGPFWDLVGHVGSELTRLLREGGERERLLAALLAELDRPGHVTLLVIEDVHWADEATLDALRLLVRRVADLPAVLLLTYRDDELGREHPLQQVLGRAAATPRVRRIALQRLSARAVRTLSAGHDVDAARVFSTTSGNPFFVSEVLKSGSEDHVPGTVVDAVLARVRQLDVATQDSLDQLSVVPSGLPRWLVDALLPGGLARLESAERRGLLTVTARQVSFVHELARRAIADSLPASRSTELNRRVLEAIVDREPIDLPSVVHHAVQAGDDTAVVRYGPPAAREAARAGAHREAAAHFRLVLRHGERFTTMERADLLEEYAIECYTVGDIVEGVRAQRSAVVLRRSLGDPVALGASLRWLSRLFFWGGYQQEAERAGDEAIAVLERTEDRRLLALAYSNRSQLDMLASRFREAVQCGRKAEAMAREMGDRAILSHALNNIGTSLWNLGQPEEGRRILEQSRALAQAAGEVDHACRADVNIIWNLLDDLNLPEASRLLAEALDHAERSEYLGFVAYLHMERAVLQLYTGAWDDAVRDAEEAIRYAASISRTSATTVLARIRIRRGYPGGEELLTHTRQAAHRQDELARLGPILAGLAESVWLRDGTFTDLDEATAAYRRARDAGHRSVAAELGYWLTKAGVRIELPSSDGHPYLLQAAGRWQEAALAWQSAGCRYEQAAALAEGNDPDVLITSLSILDALGAEPLARMVRAKLRGLGVARVPRGPAAGTRENPAGLTERQLEVVRLLAQGLTNAEIAKRLVVSVRTVDTHVAAVLDKLGVASRREAAAKAADLGIPMQSTPR